MDKELIIKILENALRSDTIKIDHKILITEAMLESIIKVLKEPSWKLGKWIKISPAGIYECSECGKNVMSDDIEEYKCCHGCGCKMEVEG